MRQAAAGRPAHDLTCVAGLGQPWADAEFGSAVMVAVDGAVPHDGQHLFAVEARDGCSQGGTRDGLGRHVGAGHGLERLLGAGQEGEGGRQGPDGVGSHVSPPSTPQRAP